MRDSNGCIGHEITCFGCLKPCTILISPSPKMRPDFPARTIGNTCHLCKSPVRPCVFVLTKGMSVVGPRPTADIPLLVFARHQHRCSDRLGVSGQARPYSASIQPSSLPSSVSALGDRLWRRRQCLWAWRLSVYRRDSASLGPNALWLASQPVRCHRTSAAIARDILPDVNWP